MENKKINEENAYQIPNIHWECEDTIRYKDGREEVIKSHNIVVRDVSKLIAGLLGLKISKGIQYWAIGSGDASWDNQWSSAPPSPNANATRLLNEIYRHPINPGDIKFIGSSGEELADTNYSNKIRVTITVSESQGNGTWREFGLVGGTANTSRNTGLLIDHKYHKVIEKTNEMSIVRKLTLEF